MFIDGTVIFGFAIIVLTCGVVGYCAHYAYRHIKQDEHRAA